MEIGGAADADPAAAVVPAADVDPAVASHPDIQICSLPGMLVVSPGIFDAVREILPKSANGNGHSIVRGAFAPSGAYPADIRYNGACFGRFFMHNLKYTDPVILERTAALGLEPVMVRQGYTKCNTVIVDDSAIITSDAGIASAAECKGIAALLVRQGHVRLDGHPYGFLGGASGRFGNRIIFNGDLTAHPDFEAIADFIGSRGAVAEYFTGYPLEDIGSILFAGDEL